MLTNLEASCLCLLAHIRLWGGGGEASGGRLFVAVRRSHHPGAVPRFFVVVGAFGVGSTGGRPAADFLDQTNWSGFVSRCRLGFSYLYPQQKIYLFLSKGTFLPTFACSVNVALFCPGVVLAL